MMLCVYMRVCVCLFVTAQLVNMINSSCIACINFIPTVVHILNVNWQKYSFKKKKPILSKWQAANSTYFWQINCLHFEGQCAHCTSLCFLSIAF